MTLFSSRQMAVAALWGAMLLAATAPAATNTVSDAMVGAWRGQARIVVAWCAQTNLAVALIIAPDGQVRGTVGDATLSKARLRRNRGALGRKLNLKTDYIVTGELRGPIVAAEEITRARVSIPLNFVGGTFSGGVHTSGTKWGGKDGMILSAGWLILVRTNAP